MAKAKEKAQKKSAPKSAAKPNTKAAKSADKAANKGKGKPASIGVKEKPVAKLSAKFGVKPSANAKAPPKPPAKTQAKSAKSDEGSEKKTPKLDQKASAKSKGSSKQLSKAESLAKMPKSSKEPAGLAKAGKISSKGVASPESLKSVDSANGKMPTKKTTLGKGPAPKVAKKARDEEELIGPDDGLMDEFGGDEDAELAEALGADEYNEDSLDDEDGDGDIDLAAPDVTGLDDGAEDEADDEEAEAEDGTAEGEADDDTEDAEDAEEVAEVDDESDAEADADEDESSPAGKTGKVRAGSAAVEKKQRKRDDLKIDRGGDLEQQWQTLFDKSKGIKPLPYKMSDNYEAKTPIMHKVLGWGYVLSSQNNRIEVLFKEGIKVLITNYKGS